jgi:tRNA threonylcarbamoyladenosine biosynthesis protein TsaE
MTIGQLPKPEATALHLHDAAATKEAGKSLAKSLYSLPLTVLLQGEVGAGKTTFLQGFAEALSVEGNVLSPTFALEQRHQTKLGELLHMDLYRLQPYEAAKVMGRTHDHEGIRVVEWADRSPPLPTGEPHISLKFSEEGSGRTLQCTFSDIAIPGDEAIDQWRKDVDLPEHIVRHCNAVGAFAEMLAKKLRERGILARGEALRAAGKCHDLLRFIDFRGDAGPKGIEEKPSPMWDIWKKKFEGIHHEEAMAKLLHEKGYPDLGEIVRTHGLWLPPDDDARTEQLLLYYADKRLKLDEVVSLEERFADLRERYGEEHAKMQTDVWMPQCKKIEGMLFPEGAP